MNRRTLAALAVVLGIALIAIAIVYWVEPAKSLPSFFPGHQAGSSHHHTKHGIASFLVGLACFAFAWFNTGPKKHARGFCVVPTQLLPGGDARPAAGRVRALPGLEPRPHASSFRSSSAGTSTRTRPTS